MTVSCPSDDNDKSTDPSPSLSDDKNDHPDGIESESSLRGRRSGRKRKAETANPVQERKPKQPKKAKDVEEELDMAWICAECREAECLMHPEADQLLVCEGPCIRVFHYPCAGLSKMPAEDEKYICKDCTENRHACAICKEYGIDDKEVFKCSKHKCGLFFHESCLSMQNVEVQVVPITSANSSSTSSLETAPAEKSKLIFTCPAHNCWTCTQWELKKEEEDEAKEAAAIQKGSKSRGKKKKQSLPGFFSCKKEATLVVSC